VWSQPAEQAVMSLSRSKSTDDVETRELSQNTKRVLELSVEEARRMGHHYIGTEHLLLGLLRAEDVTTGVLKRLGLNHSEIRKCVRRVIQEKPINHPIATLSINLHKPASAEEAGTVFRAALNLMLSIEALHPSIAANDPN
jgi:ATP-dependent Clp protease ATP-binding subunit ClpA